MALSAELYWLVLTCLMTGLLWVPYIINRMIEHRPLPALWNPMPDVRPKALWAERLMRAHENAIENLMIFAPLVLTIEILKVSTEITILACMVYFIARALHVVVFTFAVPLLRVITFVVAFGAQMVLVIHLLTL
jgi:uncharacterized MAPEG superfamily protein